MTFSKKSLFTLSCFATMTSAIANELPAYQAKYICKHGLPAEANELEFVLSYEAKVLLQSLKITKLNGEKANIEASNDLLFDRYILPSRKVINFQYQRNETTENLVTLESVKNSVVAPDNRFNKFNAEIKINDGQFLKYSCKDEELL